MPTIPVRIDDPKKHARWKAAASAAGLSLNQWLERAADVHADPAHAPATCGQVAGVQADLDHLRGRSHARGPVVTVTDLADAMERLNVAGIGVNEVAADADPGVLCSICEKPRSPRHKCGRPQ